MKVIQGDLQAKGLKFAIIVSRFNDFITGKLLVITSYSIHYTKLYEGDP